MNYVYINKKFILEQKALISIKERGFRYGDGIFETFKIVNGIIYDYKSHESRIKNGLKVLQISCDISSLEKISNQLIKKNKVSNGLLRVSISRGCGSMGYLPKENIKSLLVIETINEKRVTSKNIKLGISDIKLPRKEKDFLEIKTAQSLNYVLAKIAAHKKGNFDDVILSEDNFVSECSSSNIFWVKNNKLYSPTLDCYCLAGTIRKKIIENFDVNLVKAKISDLKNADEIFITNTNILVLAVDEFESKKLAKNFIKKILDFIENDVKNYVKKKTSKHI